MHRHYDLLKIERDIRDMFNTVPGDAIHGDPAVVAAFRRSVDIEVAFSNWFFNEIMRGTNASDCMNALIAIFVNLIMNRMRAFTPDPGEDHPIAEFMSDLIDGVGASFQNYLENGIPPHAVEVSPVTSGRA